MLLLGAAAQNASEPVVPDTNLSAAANATNYSAGAASDDTVANASASNGTRWSGAQWIAQRMQRVDSWTRQQAVVFRAAATRQSKELPRKLRQRALDFARASALLLTSSMKRAKRASLKAAVRWRSQLLSFMRHQKRDLAEQLRSWKRAFAEQWRKLRRRDRAVSRILRRASSKEWYKLLQVRRRAEKSKLREAYRRLAKRVHPDKTKDDRAPQAFDALRDAYELLNDSDQRARYDKALAVDDELARRRREKQRRAALQGVRSAAAACWRHKRVTLAVVAVLFVRFGLPDVSAPPARLVDSLT